MSQIKIVNLQKSFGDFTAVKNSNLTINDKEFFVLLGPSGCGKTTTLRMIAGLELPTSGEIYLGDEEVGMLRASERDIAFVFQLFALYPHMNVRNNLSFPLKMQGYKKSDIKSRVEEAAKLLRIDHILNSNISSLSGGDRQRVALGRALVRRPKAFLMDEPLSNLDAKLRVSTRAQIKNLSHELAITTIYVTHDQIEAMTLADRVVVMKQGIVQQVGSPTDIYDRPANSFVAGFIGSPAMNLIEGKIIKGVFSSNNTSIRGLKADDGEIILGFRAEDATVVKEKGQLNSQIFTLEILGDATMVTVKVGKSLVSIKANKNFRANIEDKVSVKIPAQKCHLFDKKTGERVGGINTS